MKKIKLINKIKNSNKPEVNHYYYFYDDGKISRKYIAKVIDIIPISDFDKNIKRVWKIAVKDNYWILAKKTDFVIKCDIPEYDTNPVYFVRAVDGEWFSFDYPTTWMSGRLSVNEEVIGNE